jgi:hypothetical protein
MLQLQWPFGIFSGAEEAACQLDGTANTTQG